MKSKATSILRWNLLILMFAGLIGCINSTQNNDESQIFKIVIERIPNETDTHKFRLFIRDSLVRINKDMDSRWFSDILEKRNFTDHGNRDSLFIPVLEELIDSTNSKPFDTSIIKTDIYYKLISTNLSNRAIMDANEPHKFIVYTFSPIAFNNKHTLACMYEFHFCGVLCAGGEFLFFRKKDGKWMVDSTGFLSVS